MAGDLASMQARVQTLLMDTAALVWDTGTLTEGLRLALGEYNLAGRVQDPGTALGTISGLDGAPATNLTIYESLVVLGGAGYCATARAVDRASSYALGEKAETLKAWGEARLKEFRAQLGAVYPKYGVAGSAGEEDPAKAAAEVALLGAQAELAQAQAAASAGQEGRAAAAAAQAALDRAAEAARLAELRAGASPWGGWADPGDIAYPEGYERK